MNNKEAPTANYAAALYDLEQQFFLEDGPSSPRLLIVSELIMESSVDLTLIPKQREGDVWPTTSYAVSK